MLYLLAKVSEFFGRQFYVLCFYLRKKQEIKFDRMFGVNTAIQANEDFSEYVPVDTVLFKKCMVSLDLHMQNEVFADFGSGKGRAVLLAAQYGFPRIIGLEYNPALMNILSRNIQAFHHSSHIKLICCDIKDYQFNDEITVIFFNDPFPYYRFCKFMVSVKESYLRKKRRIYLIYVNAKQDVVKCILALDIFKKYGHVTENTMPCSRCFGAHIFSTDVIENTFKASTK